MCLAIDKAGRKRGKPHIAQQDIKVYKLLNKGRISPQMRYQWPAKLLVHAKLKVKKHFNVFEGLHAYVTLKAAKRNTRTIFVDKRFVHHATIPRGALYYKGMNTDIVSTAMIVHGRVR